MTTDMAQKGSVARRLTLGFVLTALASVMLVGALLIGLLRLAAKESAFADLRVKGEAIAREPRLLERDPLPAVRVFRRAFGLSGVALYRLSANGELVFVGGYEVIAIDNLDAPALNAGRTQEGTAGPNLVFLARPVGNRGRVVAVLSRRATALPDVFGQIAGRLLIAGLAATVLAGLVGSWLARRISKPLKELATATANLAGGNLEQRVPVRSNDEIGTLAESFNRMAGELATSDGQQREFFLSISHELRTPLTAIQGYAEGIEDGTVDAALQKQAAGVIVEQTRRLARLVSDLLDLARIESHRFQVHLEETDVGDVLENIRQAFGPTAQEAGIDLSVPTSAGHVRADRDRLSQVLSNLVENALRYTPAGKRIALSSAEEDGVVAIRIADGGVGFEPGDLGRAFERQFLWEKYRAVRDVGTGLGLAITQELVLAMGGSVEARGAPGGGAEFVVRLPLAT